MIPRKAIQEEVARLLAQSKQRLPSVPPPLVLPLAALRQRLSPQTPFRLPPQNPRRLVLSTALLLTSIFLVVLFWSVHNDSSHTSTLSRLYLYEPDESFPATQLPSTNQHNDGVRKAKGKGMRPSKGKGAAKGNEKDEKPSPEPLPKFWSVHGGTGRGETNTTKPRGVNKVMGLVFYGRRSTASILDCYLKVRCSGFCLLAA